MPLILPQELPAYRALEQENVFVMQRRRAQMQDIRPLQILILNLMPTKIATETQLARVLANSPLQVELTLLHMDSHVSTHVSGIHLEAFYKTFEDVKNRRFDGMIITGAPVEMMPFEQVDYWNELCRIFDYSKTHVYSTLHICWGAQAALYHHYGIQKELLPAKISGVYAHRVLRPKTPLLRGFDELFYAPHSRYTAVNRADVAREKALRVLADSDEAGLHLLETDSGRQIFVCGHMEYDKYTLRDEYRRDVAKGLAIAPPAHYFIDDDPAKDVLFRWRSHANLLFSNWLNYYVYQATPFNLENLT
ncbi:MAG: homoserine O-succinyltransferase [Ruthenibacterium sp.]